MLDMSKYVALMPAFREDTVDTFFNAFERLATAPKWPSEIWSLLVQCKIQGKALQVASALNPKESLLYDKVKAAVLCAYELVPEAYRQRFRKSTEKVQPKLMWSLPGKRGIYLTIGALRAE